MFFISGFGSIIPYIAYISLIWICLLFGYRLTLTELFKTKPAEANSIVDCPTHADVQNTFVFSTAADSKVSQLNNEIACIAQLPCFSPEYFRAEKPLRQIVFSLHPERVFINHLLRAPPAMRF